MEVRRILEEFSAEISRRSPLLTEAYGKMLFKCPIISCIRFYRGFENPEQRDKHIGQHERAHKCTHEGCDYRELGFPTEIELRKHDELCHKAFPEEPTFPNVQRVNLSKALNDAIDRDDVQAVQDICTEVLACPLRPTGFVLRAMKRQSISTALVLIELLGNDVEMNHVDSKGRTVLHEAVQIRNDDLFDRILDTEINVEVQEHNGLTPFLKALREGYFYAIRLLMNHAAVNTIPREDLGVYIIYYRGMNHAAAAGVDDILKALFSSFVSLCKHRVMSKRIDCGDLIRIITQAALNRHQSSVKLILELAHAHDLESGYQGLLRKELHHGIEGMTTFFMQRHGGAKQEMGKDRKTYGTTTLANAAKQNDSALVMRLLKDGADLNLQDEDKETALYKASTHGHKKIVEVLVQNGADVNLQNIDGETALYRASRNGYKEVAEILIGNGADVNLQDIDGETALYAASDRGYKEIAKILVQEGANVNLPNIRGQTALFQACQGGFKEIVTVLVQEGSDVNLRNNVKQTALHKASERGHKNIVKILVRMGADVNLQGIYEETALFAAFRKGNREVVQVLIEAEIDLEMKGSHQRTALLQAAERGWEDIVQILIDKGADIDSVDEDQQTALLIASRNGHVEVCCMLLASGAKGFEATNDLQLLLVGNEANLRTHGEVYDNALSSACSFGLESVVKMLVEEAEFKIPVETYNRALRLIGSRRYVRPYDCEAIAKLLREGRAVTALPDLKRRLLKHGFHGYSVRHGDFEKARESSGFDESGKHNNSDKG